MTLSKERLNELLEDRPVKFKEQTASTQDIALRWLVDGADDGAVVVADEQLAGRGRDGRTWQTPPGVALAFSVILRPASDVISRTVMVGAVAIAEMIEGLGADDVAIKWPNDVLLNGRKVCGILPEAVWDGDQLQGVALGIGVNVRVDFAGTELVGIATSIEAELDVTLDRADVLAKLLERIDYWYERLDSPQLLAAWKDRMSMLGQQVTISSVHGDLNGIAEGVDKDGTLLVRDEDGELNRVVAGDVAIN
jgi:BirA family transcriptional regulator, biotin operon repressor / biotin---[acetyl-CoA-carboxylase] ligase